MARKPDVALSIAAFGSPANRKILPDIHSKSTASWTMLSTFDTNHASLKIMLYSVIKKTRITAKVLHVLLLKILHGSQGNTF